VCRRGSEDGYSVAQVARDFGVRWATVMAAVRGFGRPRVGDPRRLDGVAALSIGGGQTAHAPLPRTDDQCAESPGVTAAIDLLNAPNLFI